MRTASLTTLAATTVVALGLWATGALATTSASGITLCADKGGGLVYSAGGTCSQNKTALVLAADSDVQALAARVQTLESEVTSLRSLLSGVTRTTFDGADTLRFSGMNLQVVNGQGSTDTTNGLGNLIVGYDDYAADTSGSHDIVVGDANSFSSYGGLVAGRDNEISGPFASVTGGFANTADGAEASVTGGSGNFADGTTATVSGGDGNVAGGESSWIGAGLRNDATGRRAAVAGGNGNQATGENSAILGGAGNIVGTPDGTSP
jgi:hypothetical protein